MFIRRFLLTVAYFCQRLEKNENVEAELECNLQLQDVNQWQVYMTCTFDARKLARYSILAFSDVFSYCILLIESGIQNTMEGL